MTTETVNSIDLAEARAKLYQMLTRVYMGSPGRNFLKFLASWVEWQVKNASPSLSQQMKQGLATLDNFFTRQSCGEELEEAASIEFTRLFLGVKPGYSPLPPYESVYIEENGHIFSEVTSAVHQEYSRFGLDLADGLSGEPPDHISFELEFLHFLCHQEAEALKKNDQEEARRLLGAEKEFLREHLMAWTPRFFDQVREYDRLGLFRGLADVTEGWINFDYHSHLQMIESPSLL